MGITSCKRLPSLVSQCTGAFVRVPPVAQPCWTLGSSVHEVIPKEHWAGLACSRGSFLYRKTKTLMPPYVSHIARRILYYLRSSKMLLVFFKLFLNSFSSFYFCQTMFSSVAQPRLSQVPITTACQASLVHHQFPESTQIYVH